MKFKLSTLLWIVTVASLAILLLLTQRNYQSLSKKYHVRQQLIENEYRRVTGQEIADFQLDAAMAQCDQSAVAIATGFARLDLLRISVGILDEPKVILQARSGAVGGNPIRVNMVGGNTGYEDKQSKVGLDFDSDVNADTKAETFYQGGYIPSDKVFVVDRIEYHGIAKGDSNGDGRLMIKIGATQIIDIYAEGSDPPKEVNAVWKGKVVLQEGIESSVFLEISNSSALEVEISGRFEPLKDHQK